MMQKELFLGYCFVDGDGDLHISVPGVASAATGLALTLAIGECAPQRL